MSSPRNSGGRDDADRAGPRRSVARTRSIVAGAVSLAAALLAYALFPELRAEVNAAVRLAATADLAPLREYLLGFGIWAPVASGLLQLLTSVIAPLPSFVLALANALLFGFVWGGLLTFTTALLAAGVCFGLSRAFGRPLVERFVSTHVLDTLDGFFERRGAWAVIIARFIPFINPDAVSYAAGLTPMRLRIFLGATAIGSLPSTVLYSWLGARGTTSVGWLAIPLVGLGLIAFVAVLWHGHRRSRRRTGRGITP